MLRGAPPTLMTVPSKLLIAWKLCSLRSTDDAVDLFPSSALFSGSSLISSESYFIENDLYRFSMLVLISSSLTSLLNNSL